LPEAAAEIAVLGGELDRSKGAGKTHGSERDPGHYVDLADNGEVMGVIPPDKPPITREALAADLRDFARARDCQARRYCPQIRTARPTRG
jgi:hypothetical protein